MIPSQGGKQFKGSLLQRILRCAGAYYHSADLFYHEIWKQRLEQIGFRVRSVEKLPYHQVWEIRLRGTLSAQAHLLLSRPAPKRLAGSQELLLGQLRSEIQEIALDFGPPVKPDCISVARNGRYIRAGFIWPPGKPGLLLTKNKKAGSFSRLIRPWLHKKRN
jgi:hypothetical protein